MSAPAPASSLRVDWLEYNRLIERLAVLIHESGYTFDSILCLARGGMRAGDVLSRLFQVPLAILSTSSYRDNAGTVAGNLDIAQHITTTGGDPKGKLLLVDDLVDSGNTFQQVQDHLRRRFPAITEIRTAVLWYKDISTVAPEYFVERVPGGTWIHQPFEEYDGIEIGELAKRYAT